MPIVENMDLRISGRTALVTGADSGIGWSTAKILLDEGVTVVITDLDQASLDEAAARLGAPD
ncbi:SDR family NAD(P)-dependent oxidoreductase, partial [Agreia sp.]|uniref:SDR family NAD(P)-dependent oxidoreductase n=1 Tax=Agreia sp. TaxID=1872416 RepID=UPI0035BBEC1B